MILKKYVLKLIKLQIIRLLVFCFMLFFLYYVFKARSLAVVYGFGVIFLIIFTVMLITAAISAALFGITLVKQRQANIRQIEKGFAEGKPLCGEYYITEDYLLVFKVRLTEAELRLIPFSDVKKVEWGKTQKGDGLIINITTEKRDGREKKIKYILYSDNEKMKNEFNELFKLIAEKTK